MPTVHEEDPIIDNTPIKTPSVPTKLRMNHCLPDKSVIPASLRGYICYIYDERPTLVNINKQKDVKMSVNIFGWTPINPLQFG